MLPEYDRALLLRELRLFPDWYVAKHLGVDAHRRPRTSTLTAAFELILANNLAQPRVYVHRDYHSRNLMVTEPNPGILDFQDAVYGPITYDLVSLFGTPTSAGTRSALDWVVRYWEKARKARLPVDADFGAFYRDFEWMGVQRQIKVLGIFARLFHRDGKSGYLQDMPLVMAYLRKACERYSDLHPLLRLLDELDRAAAGRGIHVLAAGPVRHACNDPGRGPRRAHAAADRPHAQGAAAGRRQAADRMASGEARARRVRSAS